jgi:hypothetical protein
MDSTGRRTNPAEDNVMPEPSPAGSPLAWKVQNDEGQSNSDWTFQLTTERKGQKLMKVMKIAAMLALLALATTTQSRADHTNLVQTINLRLYGLKQGATTTNRSLVMTSVNTVRLDTRQVIQALAAATANTFSPTSRLALVTPLNGGSPSVQVRDGDVRVDVTGFFVLEQIGTSVTSGIVNTRTGASVQTTYSIQRLALREVEDPSALTVHFDVNGLAVDTTTTNIGRHWPGNGSTIDVTGTGDRHGAPLVIQGTISVIGNSLEIVVPDGGML